MYQEVSMLPPKQSRKVLVKMIRNKYIANLDELFHVLDTHSRMSVFRRLKPLGYLSSFTDAGSFYTLQDIPKFDTLGLWFYQGVGFSRAGTLKSTVIDIVHFSEAGKTARLLRDLPGAHARTKEFPARGANYRAWNIRCA